MPQRYSPSQIYGSIHTQEDQRRRKLQLYQEQLQLLKQYINSVDKIEKKKIRDIFKWDAVTDEREGEDRKILKELSTKVKGLIRQNHQLRHRSEPQEVSRLRKENKELLKLLKGVHKGESVREETVKQENIRTSDGKQYRSQKLETHIEQQSNGQNEKYNQKLKNYLVTYINTIAEQNYQKLKAQSNYVNALEKRLEKLQQVQRDLQHLKFQRSVQIQNTYRLSQSIIMSGMHKLQGDHDDHLEQDYKVRFPQKHVEMMKPMMQPKMTLMMTPIEVESQLKEEITTLQVEIQNLKDKYSVQIQNHIRDNIEKEQILHSKQKLLAENKELKYEKKTLHEQMTAALGRMSHLQEFIQNQKKNSEEVQQHLEDSKVKNIKDSSKQRLLNCQSVGIGSGDLSCNEDFPSQVRSIRDSILSCNLSNFDYFRSQVTQIISERNGLRKEINLLRRQNTKVYRQGELEQQLVLLKQRNSILEENCQMYQKQINRFTEELRELGEINERRLAEEIATEIESISKGRDIEENIEGLQWQGIMKNCLMASVNRLQNLQKAMRRNLPSSKAK